MRRLVRSRAGSGADRIGVSLRGSGQASTKSAQMSRYTHIRFPRVRRLRLDCRAFVRAPLRRPGHDTERDHGSGLRDRPLGQPAAHRRLRVHRVRGARPGGARPPVRADGLHRGGEAPQQERAALPPGRDQLHRQRGTGELRAVVRARARAVDLRDSVPRRRRGARLSHVRGQRRLGRRGAPRPDGARDPGDQGHRRLADLPRRPLHARRPRGVDLRHRLRAAARGRPEPRRRGAHHDRPPHAQRLPRPHGRVGELLRAPVQLPRGALLRHRGQAHGTQVQGDDLALRQDPHPDQRVLG